MQSAEQSFRSARLSFAGVKGTTAQSVAQFAVLDEKIAYVAGSGVIVAAVDTGGTVANQRLFVANNNNDMSSPTSEILPKQDNLTCEDEPKKDSYGFPVNYTHHYGGPSAETEMNPAGLFEKKDWAAIPGAKSKLKHKVRAPTCVAISPNGRVLAVGESGYMPRILLFSLAPDSSRQPFAVIYEHSFGVCHLMFSPDLKYFCSLGTMSDGFLYVWKYSATSVICRAGNKCITVVNDMLWHDTGSELGEIITLGLRSLKIWLLDVKDSGSSPAKRSVLRGRNIVLGTFLDSNFQAAIPLSREQILVKELRSFFVLSLKSDLPLQQIALDRANVSGLVADNADNALWVFDHDFQAQKMPLEGLKIIPAAEYQPTPTISPSKLAQGIQQINLNQDPAILQACCYGDNHIIYLTNKSEIWLHEKKTGQSVQLVHLPVTSVSGGKRVSSGEILIFSKTGKIVSLADPGTMSHLATHMLPQVGNLINELTAVEKSATTLFLGDKYGLLTVLDISAEEPRIELVIKAHSSSINDIIYFEVEGNPILCSISRDRMIQVYSKVAQQWEVMCTLPTHTANLIAVSFAEPYLFVCSADRSISVHELVKNDSRMDILHKKTITLKNTPLAMDVSGCELVISSDRSLSVYHKLMLEFKRNVKLYCEKSNEALSVDRFLLLESNQIAVFCSDRSLRIYNLVSGKHLTSVWGHLELVSGLFETKNSLMSLGSDGCLFKWKLSSKPNGANATNGVTAANGANFTNGASGPETEKELNNLLPSEVKSPTPELDASPLYAKVTRKFLPTAQMARPNIFPGKKPSLSSSEDTTIEPESPTPRLTSAALKRIEARKRALMTLSPSSPKQQAQAQPAHNSNHIGGISPFRSKSVSPPKSLLQHSQTTPFNRTQVSTRQSPVSRSIQAVAKTPNMISPQKVTTPSLPPPLTSSSDVQERSSAYLTMIKSFIRKGIFEEEYKQTLQKELEEALALLGGGSEIYDGLLQKFSDELVSLVRDKLGN